MPLILNSKIQMQNLKEAQFGITFSAQVSSLLGEQSIFPDRAVCSLRGSQELCLTPPDVDNPTTHLKGRWHWPQEAQVRSTPIPPHLSAFRFQKCQKHSIPGRARHIIPYNSQSLPVDLSPNISRALFSNLGNSKNKP